MSDNQVTLTGNLTDDPELRFTPNGVAVANFRLAVDQRVWDTDGWKDGEPSYFRVNVWRDQAEYASRSLHKGARTVVVGRLKSRSWETPEGDKRTAVEIEADDVEEWAAATAARHGYTEARHIIDVFGLCPACSAA